MLSTSPAPPVRIVGMEQNPYEAPQAAPVERGPPSFKLPGELYPGQHFGCLVQLCAWATITALIFLPLPVETELAIAAVAFFVWTVPAVVAGAVLYYRWKRRK